MTFVGESGIWGNSSHFNGLRFSDDLGNAASALRFGGFFHSGTKVAYIITRCNLLQLCGINADTVNRARQYEIEIWPGFTKFVKRYAGVQAFWKWKAAGPNPA